MKKIIFINPPTPDKNIIIIRDLDRSGRQTREKIIWPQANLAYLAAVMRNAGFDVDIMDCIASKIYWGEFEKLLKEKKPDYVLSNVISSTLTNDMKVLEEAKKLGAKTIVVGSHVSALPKESMERFKYVDYVVMGEGEETLRELIGFLEEGKDLSGVKGIAWRSGDNNIVINEKRPLIKDLDSLPIPLHELLPLKEYNLPFIGKNFTFVMESRGCPFRCIFCRSPIAWNRIFRQRSAESIFKELQYLKKLGVKNILFHSDTFTVDKEEVINLCKMIVDSGLKIKWICNSRVDTIDEEVLLWMKKAGCYMVAYGIESGSQKVLDKSNKGITVEQIKKAVKMANDAGVKVWGYFVMGLPGENNETVRETINLTKELDMALANFAVATPYPGTDFYNLVVERGWLKSNNWEEFDQNYSAVVDYPDFSGDDIVRAMKQAYKEYYFRPRAIWNLLKAIKGWHDIKVLTDTALAHLRWMFFKKKTANPAK